MGWWIYETRTGAISGVSDAATLPALPDGYAAIAGDAKVIDPGASQFVAPDGRPALRIAKTAVPADAWVMVDGAAAIAAAQAPTDGDHLLTLVGRYSGTITLTALSTLRARRWATAKAYRARKTAAGCATPLGRVQTDKASRDAIAEAASDAVARQLSLPGWSVAWIMADNSSVTHNAAQMIAMAAAVRTYIAGCQSASQAVRKALDAAATAATIAAVDITAGYPA